MGRLRFTREQAQLEAARRASEFVYGLPSCTGLKLRGTHPDTTVPQSVASKHPLAWVVVFSLDLPDGAVIDGGELFVAVNLESGAVAIRE
jgi:hypothetical protein